MLLQPSNLAGAFAASLRGRGTDNQPSHLYGSFMSLPYPGVARTLAVLGFDWVVIDALHSAINPESLVTLIHAVHFVSQGKTCAIVRVPNVHSDLLAYALDAGAAGIIFPNINTAEEAAAAVHKVRYPYSGGHRSLAPCGLIRGITDVAPPGWIPETLADRNIAVICQIDSVLAVANAEAIAATPGVDALFPGAGDLRVSLGLLARTPPSQPESPRLRDCLERVVAAGKKYDKSLMIMDFNTNGSDAEFLKSFNLIGVCADVFTIAKGQQEDLGRIKAMLSNNGHLLENSNVHINEHMNNANGYSNGSHHDIDALKAKAKAYVHGTSGDASMNEAFAAW